MMPPPMTTTRAWVGNVLICWGRATPVARLVLQPEKIAPLEWRAPSVTALPSQLPRQRGVVHLAHLRHACLHRIAAGGRVDGGHFGELVEMAFFDPAFGQGVRD